MVCFMSGSSDLIGNVPAPAVSGTDSYLQLLLKGRNSRKMSECRVFSPLGRATDKNSLDGLMGPEVHYGANDTIFDACVGQH